MARLWVMAMVLQSTTTDPARTPSTIPLGPRMTSFTMAVSPTQRNRTSAFSATSFGVAQNLPFSVLASFWALAEVLDQTATSCPARRRLRAMGYPISPSPRNPNLGMNWIVREWRGVGQIEWIPGAASRWPERLLATGITRRMAKHFTGMATTRSFGFRRRCSLGIAVRTDHRTLRCVRDRLRRARVEEPVGSHAPQFMNQQQHLLAPLHPDESALAPLFQTNFDEAMLREIAAADYGWKADECYALLQPMLKAGLVAADDLNLREKLALIHWSDPDDPEWSPSGYGQRGHWMRLFACTAMVRFAPIRRDWFEGECNTLAQLTSSAIELGQPVARAAASVLAWRFLAYPGADPDSAFLAFAILLLAAHLEREEDSGQWLKDLATWVEEEEARARQTRR